jgi:hypothetical protein
MDFLRRGFPRRRPTSESADIEQQNSLSNRDSNGTVPEMEERRSSRSQRISVGAPMFPTLLRRPMSTTRAQITEGGDIESPKTPRFTLRTPTLPSTRLHLPHLTRTWTTGSNGPESRPATARPATARNGDRQDLPSEPRFASIPTVAEPMPAASGDYNQARTRSLGFEGADLAEGRRRQGRRGRRELSNEGLSGRPKRFLFCFPWVKSRRIRSQILRCFVSGLFLTLLLTIC